MSALEPSDIEDLTEIFRVLGDPTRVRILDVLSRSEVCVQDLAGALHEVSNALTVVLGWLDVAYSRLEAGPARDAVDVARTHARLGHGISRSAIGAEAPDSTAQASGRSVAESAPNT